MIGYLEIFLVVASFVVLIVVSAQTGKGALVVKRTAGAFMGHAQPMVDYLLSGSNTAQRRVVSITERQALLQQRVYVLQVSAGKLMVLLKALGQARDRLLPYLRYIGLAS